MSEGITPTRLIMYVMIAGLLPIFYVWWSTSSSNAQVERLISRIDTVQQVAFTHEQKLGPNRAIQAAYKDADRSYLDKYVESLNLLQAETALLQKALINPVVAPDPLTVARIEQLKKNTIQFSEGTVESYPFFKEIPQSLARPVEVDVEDIRRILSEIEGQQIGTDEPGPNRPQMIITDYKLERKVTPRQAQLYTLTIKLIKREFF